MKTYKTKTMLAVAIAALAAPIQSKQLTELWQKQTTAAPDKADTTFDQVSANLNADAAETAQLNKEYQSNKYLRENIEKFEKNHKAELSGKTNNKISSTRQMTRNHEQYLYARLNEIKSARQRIRTALEKANSYVKTHATERTEGFNDLQKSFNEDNNNYLEKKSAKAEKKATKKAEKDVAAKKEKDAIEANKKKKQAKKKIAPKIEEPVERGF